MPERDKTHAPGATHTHDQPLVPPDGRESLVAALREFNARLLDADNATRWTVRVERHQDGRTQTCESGHPESAFLLALASFAVADRLKGGAR